MRHFHASLLRRIFQAFGLNFYWSAINQTRNPQTNKASKQASKQAIYSLLLIYVLMMTLIVVPASDSKATASSRRSMEENQRRVEREKEEAKRANAAPLRENLPDIRLSVVSRPLSVADVNSTNVVSSQDESLSSMGFVLTQLLAPTLSQAFSAPSALRTPHSALGTFRTPHSKNLELRTENSALFLPPPSNYKAAFDFDGDGKSDASRWRKSSVPVGEWSVLQSSNGQTTNYSLGSSSDVIVPAHFDSDYKTDYAIFNAGSWTIHKSTGGTISDTLGTSGDIPVAADYDGDAIADVAVFRPSSGTWYYKSCVSCSVISTTFGTSGDITAEADYDGDSKADFAVFRPSNGYWYILRSSDSVTQYLQWGTNGDVPVMGDYDGDGKSDVAVYRPSSGTWWSLKSSDNNNSWLTRTWGSYGDQAVPADYDGDGKTDFAVWRPSSGVWYIIKSSDDSYDYKQIGMNTDVAIPSAFLKKTGAQVSSDLLAKERLSPKNRTGGFDLYSRNIHWSSGLAGLSGRSGLGAGLSISYNSLVWMKQQTVSGGVTSTNMIFDPDTSNVTAGFRFGFPVIEPKYRSVETNQDSFILVSPSGSRTELRQTAVSNIYESADSSYIQLKIKEAESPNEPIENLSLTLYTTDGSTMKYVWKGGAYRCSEIKDSNGNYISINHDELGLLRTITDTLGRIITINYTTQSNGELLPSTITQTWGTQSGGTTSHTWATFVYTDKTINTNFSTSLPNLTVYGPPNGTSIKVLSQITYSDQSSVRFDYNDYGQVKQINNHAADGHKLNHVSFDIGSPSAGQTDCPRFTESKVNAQYWNLNASQQPQDVTTNYSIQDNQSCTINGANESNLRIITITSPDGTVDKIYSKMSDWNESFPLLSESYSSDNLSVPKRWVTSSYTQDDTSKSYIVNPRIIETKIQDSMNTKKTTIAYHTITPTSPISVYGLVSDVIEYDAAATNPYRKTHTEYNLSTAYTSRRIIGLVSERKVLDSTNNILARMTYDYDEGDFTDTTLNQNISPIQHDNTAYGAGFIIGRGNLTSTRRWDATNASTVTDVNLSVRSQIKYNTAGSAVSTVNPLGNETKISYAQSFRNITNDLNTFAYPTAIFDPENNTSVPTAKTEYDFYTGSTTKTEGKAPQNQTVGAKVKREYDDATGRLVKVITENSIANGSYVRYSYPTTGNVIETYSTITDVNNNNQADTADEAYSATYTDGLGRTIRSVSELPNSTGGYAITATEYDVMGRVKRQSTPTETNSSWQPTGDDAVGQPGRPTNSNEPFLWMSYTYDWKGRVTETTNTDSTTTEAIYEGCGCAGGEVVTIKGELVPRDDLPNTQARRTQKIYKDWLGRAYKTQVMNWNGTTPYSTTVTEFDSLDKTTKAIQYKDSELANNSCTVEQQNQGLCQVSTMEYDGHGRLKQQHVPEQDAGKFTVWTYRADDSINTMTDARGAIAMYSYNNRGLVSGISYAPPNPNPNNIPTTPSVTFAYDAVGNRTSMTEGTGGTGSTTYNYDELSRMTSETKTFSDITSRTFTISYGYNMSGALTSITDPYNTQTNYSYDKIGRLSSVTGSGANSMSTYFSSVAYRAFGKMKSINYGNSKTASFVYNNRLQASSYELSGVMKWNYEYYQDGKLKYAQDTDPSWNGVFDRSFKYDQAGRMTTALTADEARGGSQINEPPYRQTLQYDAFNHLTERTNQHWSMYYDDEMSCLNNRCSGRQYDADGRETQFGTIQTTLDTAGRRMSMVDTNERFGRFPNGRNLSYAYDGEGLQTKSSSGSSSTYFIRSTQMGGKTISEFNSTNVNQKTGGYVYVNGAVIATYKIGSGVKLEHRDPHALRDWETDANGVASRQVELDPLGNSNNRANPYPDPLSQEFTQHFLSHGDATDLSSGCTVDDLIETSPDSTLDPHSSMDCAIKAEQNNVSSVGYVPTAAASFHATSLPSNVPSILKITRYKTCVQLGDDLGGNGEQDCSEVVTHIEEIVGDEGSRQTQTGQDDFLKKIIKSDIEIARSAIDKYCTDYLNKVLANTQPESGSIIDNLKIDPKTGQFVSVDINDAFDRLSKAQVIRTDKSGIKREGVTELVNELGALPGKLYVNDSYVPQKPERRKWAIVHESLHMFVGYSDQALAIGAQRANGVKEKDLKFFASTAEGQQDASIYLNKLIEQNCKGLGESGSTTIVTGE